MIETCIQLILGYALHIYIAKIFPSGLKFTRSALEMIE